MTPRRIGLWLSKFSRFVVSASPYIGLRTEATIAMFSNLHTEGGITNHLLIRQPPYLFPYRTLMQVAREAWRIENVAPGCAFRGLSLLLDSLYNTRADKRGSAAADLKRLPNPRPRWPDPWPE